MRLEWRKTGRRPPGPKGHPVIGHVHLLWKDPLHNLLEASRDHGDLVRFDFGPFPYYLVNDVDAVKRVLIDNNRAYVKSRNYEGLKLILGEGLVTSDGELWRRQRKLAQPAFLKRRIDAFGPPIARYAAEMADAWEAERGEALDVHEEMMKLTFRIVGKTLFDKDLAHEADAIGPTVSVLIHFANDWAESLLRLPTWLPLPRNFEFRRAMASLDRLVSDIVETRRATGDEREDLLGLLMSATDEQGRMDEQQLRDEVITLVMAGHETTANLLSWTWYLLSRHPETDRALEAELDAVLGGRLPTVEDLPKLELTDRVVRESLRLYPPAWAFERDSIEDDELCGYPIPAGSTLGISPYALHRHPDHWDNPEGFDPDRWLPDAAKARNRFAYLPFGAGPRQCIGLGMALMEAKLVIATLRQRHHLALVPGHRVELDPAVTLRPKHGMRMTVRPRTAPQRPHDQTRPAVAS